MKHTLAFFSVNLGVFTLLKCLSMSTCGRKYQKQKRFRKISDIILKRTNLKNISLPHKNGEQLLAPRQIQTRKLWNFPQHFLLFSCLFSVLFARALLIQHVNSVRSACVHIEQTFLHRKHTVFCCFYSKNTISTFLWSLCKLRRETVFINFSLTATLCVYVSHSK